MLNSDRLRQFLDAIQRATPSQIDGLLNVFADWLEENGDERSDEVRTFKVEAIEQEDSVNPLWRRLLGLKPRSIVIGYVNPAMNVINMFSAPCPSCSEMGRWVYEDESLVLHSVECPRCKGQCRVLIVGT